MIDLSVIKSAEPVTEEGRIAEMILSADRAWQEEFPLQAQKGLSGTVIRELDSGVLVCKQGLSSTGSASAVHESPMQSVQMEALAKQRGFEWAAGHHDRVIPYWASDDRKDRHGDRVDQRWDFKDFEKNPVMLENHAWEGLPIGGVIDWGVKTRSDPDGWTGDALELHGLFATKEMNDRADRIFRLSKAGFMRAGSVGFLPKTVLDVKDRAERKQLGLGPKGLVYSDNSLIEWSPVAVPAHAHAGAKLVRAKSLGLLDPGDVQVIRSIAKRSLNGEASRVDAEVRAVWRMLYPDSLVPDDVAEPVTRRRATAMVARSFDQSNRNDPQFDEIFTQPLSGRGTPHRFQRTRELMARAGVRGIPAPGYYPTEPKGPNALKVHDLYRNVHAALLAAGYDHSTQAVRGTVERNAYVSPDRGHEAHTEHELEPGAGTRMFHHGVVVRTFDAQPQATMRSTMRSTDWRDVVRKAGFVTPGAGFEGKPTVECPECGARARKSDDGATAKCLECGATHAVRKHPGFGHDGQQGRRAQSIVRTLSHKRKHRHAVDAEHGLPFIGFRCPVCGGLAWDGDRDGDGGKTPGEATCESCGAKVDVSSQDSPAPVATSAGETGSTGAVTMGMGGVPRVPKAPSVPRAPLTLGTDATAAHQADAPALPQQAAQQALQAAGVTATHDVAHGPDGSIGLTPKDGSPDPASALAVHQQLTAVGYAHVATGQAPPVDPSHPVGPTVNYYEGQTVSGQGGQTGLAGLAIAHYPGDYASLSPGQLTGRAYDPRNAGLRGQNWGYCAHGGVGGPFSGNPNEQTICYPHRIKPGFGQGPHLTLRSLTDRPVTRGISSMFETLLNKVVELVSETRQIALDIRDGLEVPPSQAYEDMEETSSGADAAQNPSSDDPSQQGSQPQLTSLTSLDSDHVLALVDQQLRQTVIR